MFEIFVSTAPGLEPWLIAEAKAHGFAGLRPMAGGMAFDGDWADVWRANLTLRGASRVLVRMGSFRAMHLAQLDKRARKFTWADWIAPGTPVRIETTCRKSRIYHAGAATQRVATALQETLNAQITDTAALRLLVRIEDDLVSFSLDSSGSPLHKRGHKEAVGKAPMRETMAALFLRAAGYDGQMPVRDPMCGSGTFVIEAAEMAAGLLPGRSRNFAFEDLPSFDAARFDALQTPPRETDLRFTGSDRDAGAIKMSQANAARAGVSALCDFTQAPVSDIVPDGPPGLVICNPPYGARIGNKGALFALHKSLGDALRSRFAGWRVGIITSDAQLARATALPLDAGPYVAHGGLKVRLYSGQLG